MSKHKNQHYVPQQYLRNFSWDKRKLINLFNINLSNKFSDLNSCIKTGSISGQCSEDYFYGKDLVIEKNFQNLERDGSRIITEIINNNTAPKLYTADHYTLLIYTLFQQARTKYASELHDEFAGKLGGKLAKIILKKIGYSGDIFDDVTITLENPIERSLQIAGQIMPITVDLMCKVLINKTDTNFVTSDNPVVLYNWSYEKGSASSYTGLASKGLMIITPLSPRHILIFYDKKLYKTGDKRNLYANVTEKSDVYQFNDLQWLNALENIYFDKVTSKSEILRGGKRNIKKRLLNKINISEHKTNERGGVIIQTQNKSPNIGMNLHCIKKLAHVNETEMNDGIHLIRNIKLAKDQRDFAKDVENGIYKPNEMYKFYEDRYPALKQKKSI